MTLNKQASRREHRNVKATDNERDFALVLATSARRRQASKAGKMWASYKQSPARWYMNFQQFQRPSVRNGILAEYGLEPIDLPHKLKPARSKQVTMH